MKTPFVRKEDDSSLPEAPWGLPNRFPASKRGSSLRPLPLALSSVSPCLPPSLGRGSRAGLGCREHHCHRSVFSLGRCSLCFLWPLPKGPHSPRPGACPGELHSCPLGPGRGSWVLGALPRFGSTPSRQVVAASGRTLQIRAMQHPLSWGQNPIKGNSGDFQETGMSLCFLYTVAAPSIPLGSSISQSWLCAEEGAETPIEKGSRVSEQGEGASRYLPTPQLLLVAPN